MITFTREKAAKHTQLSYWDWALEKARTWQRQVCSRKHKYEPNLVTFQNKKHYRKKPSLWEILLVDNYRFSVIIFKSYTNKNFKIWHSCFHLYLWWAIPVFANTNTEAASSLGASVGTEVCCAIWAVLRSAWAEPGWELLLPFHTALPSTKCQTMEFMHIVLALLRQPHQWGQL